MAINASVHGYNDLRDIAPVLQGACMLIWTEYSCNVSSILSDVHSCTRKNRPRSNLPVFKSFGGSKPLRIWQTKKPKWVKLKDKKASYRIRKGN
ncbi:hypothetical protein TNCV_3694901 [Trichonephila clavipes]|nr:hypothetical protein TNCV_3694901 [Trichonephila clavipes]